MLVAPARRRGHVGGVRFGAATRRAEYGRLMRTLPGPHACCACCRFAAEPSSE